MSLKPHRDEAEQEAEEQHTRVDDEFKQQAKIVFVLQRLLRIEFLDEKRDVIRRCEPGSSKTRAPLSYHRLTPSIVC